MIKRLGFINKSKVWQFVNNYNNKLVNEKWNGRENSSGRKCIWLGLGVELGINNKVFNGENINAGLKNRINELWGNDEWNSILIYKYDKGVELKCHIDRDIFEDRVIIINISDDGLFGGNVRFIYNNKIELLNNGEVIEINNKISHGVMKVDSERWSISIRKVKI